jgi:hypothetical protein
VTRRSPAVPYVGLTGAATVDDAALARTLAAELAAAAPGWRLMVGVLAGAGQEGRGWTDPRDPALLAVCGALAAVPGVALAVHLVSDGEGLEEQVDAVVERIAGLAAVQLNTVRPDPAAVARMAARHPGVEVVVQANRRSLADATADAVVRFACPYLGHAAHLLLDLSEGRGVPLDAGWVRSCLAAGAAEWRDPGTRIVIAGGLGPGCGPLLSALATETDEPFSVDAEGRVVRRAGRGLDPDAATAYVRDAARALAAAWPNAGMGKPA